MKLHIFDVKQFMYAGQSKREVYCDGVIEDQNNYRPNEMRVGSICYLFDIISNLKFSDNNVLCFCCDSKPTIKTNLMREVLYMTYKGIRNPAPAHVKYQFKIVEELLRQMSFNVFKEEGYEADDLISSLVYKYKKVFEEVIIYTNDSDQYYLIDKNVRCEHVSSNVRSVNLSGYVDACSKKVYTPYNKVMLNKILYGEPGDNIPSIAVRYRSMVDKCVPEVINKYLGDAQLLRTIVKALVQNDEKAMCVCDLIIPLLVLDKRTDIGLDKRPDWNLFTFYATSFGCEAYRNSALPESELGESTLMQMLEIVNG